MYINMIITMTALLATTTLAVLARINYVTKAMAMSLGRKVVAEHAHPILVELGMGDTHDGVLDRIVVSEDIEPGTMGRFQSMERRGRFESKGRYVRGSGTVHLYPLTKRKVWIMSKPEGPAKEILNLRIIFSKKRFEKELISTLAHELRHYWQYDTGEINNHSLQFFGVNLLPYHRRWEEKDANAFADEYLAKK